MFGDCDPLCDRLTFALYANLRMIDSLNDATDNPSFWRVALTGLGEWMDERNSRSYWHLAIKANLFSKLIPLIVDKNLARNVANILVRLSDDVSYQQHPNSITDVDWAILASLHTDEQPSFPQYVSVCLALALTGSQHAPPELSQKEHLADLIKKLLACMDTFDENDAKQGYAFFLNRCCHNEMIEGLVIQDERWIAHLTGLLKSDDPYLRKISSLFLANLANNASGIEKIASNITRKNIAEYLKLEEQGESQEGKEIANNLRFLSKKMMNADENFAEREVAPITASVSGGLSKPIFLHKLLHDKGNDIPWSVRLQIAYGIAEKLKKLHEEGETFSAVLTSSSVRVFSDSRVELVNNDFEPAGPTDSASMTAVAPATPSRFREEIAVYAGNPNGSAENTPAADIFAFGAILYELLRSGDATPLRDAAIMRCIQRINEGLDSSRDGGKNEPPEGFLHLLVACRKPKPIDRPSAQKLVESLKQMSS